MCEKKSCIYEMYGWMGVVGKYTGCFPLPGLYEKREWSKVTKSFINYVIPALNFSYGMYGVVMMYVDYRRNFQHDLTDLLVVIMDYFTFLHFVLSLFFNQLSFRRHLVSYLKQHEKVDELLEAKKFQLKFLIASYFFVFISFQMIHLFLLKTNNELNGGMELFYAFPVIWMLRNFIKISIRLVIAISICTHPQLMYMVFQYILKRAFDQLLKKIIEENGSNNNLSGKKRVKNLRKYGRLYGDLCRLSSRLDRMMSPLLLIRFTQHYTDQIFSLTFLNRSFSVDNYARIASIVLRCVTLVLVPNFAYLTQKSMIKIQGAMHSTFKSEDKIMQAELQNFALQSMYFKKFFSASDFIKMDRELILTIFHSIVSQVVVFYKIHKYKV